MITPQVRVTCFNEGRKLHLMIHLVYIRNPPQLYTLSAAEVALFFNEPVELLKTSPKLGFEPRISSFAD